MVIQIGVCGVHNDGQTAGLPVILQLAAQISYKVYVSRTAVPKNNTREMAFSRAGDGSCARLAHVMWPSHRVLGCHSKWGKASRLFLPKCVSPHKDHLTSHLSTNIPRPRCPQGRQSMAQVTTCRAVETERANRMFVR